MAKRLVLLAVLAGAAALQLPGGELVDLPVAQRARCLLELAGTRS
jgi:hypothetical protein